MPNRLSNYKIWVMLMILILMLPLPVHAMDQEKPQALYTNARAAALIDVTSGRILYSYHGDEELPIASLTKIMTAIVAIEEGKMEDIVKVSKTAYAKEGSSLYLQLGEEMSLENMLYGLMLRSGNDAATAIAEHIGGSEEGFVHLMNEKVKFLGLEHTHFVNPHGLDGNGHYSSANDLAQMTAYAMHNPIFKEIVKTPSKTVPNPNDPWDYKWGNKNKMLRLYEGADGVKTGYTKIAKRTLVSSATRENQQLVAVTINDGDDWNDHRKLLDYGFANFPLHSLMEKGASIKGTTFVTAKSFSYPLTSSEENQVNNKLVLNRLTPESFGYRGKIEISLNGASIGVVPVYEESSYIPDYGASITRYQSTQVEGGYSNRWKASVRAVFRSLFLFDY